MKKRCYHRVLICLILFLSISTITIAQPNADFSASVTTGCNPLQVQFKDLSTGNPTSWFWDFGNGQTWNGQSPPLITYNFPGVYSVTLIVGNGSGKDSLVKPSYINVNASPIAKFGAVTPGGCFPVDVQFTDSSIAVGGTITSWSWNFGDGFTSNVDTPVHNYADSGTYTVSLTVTNSSGCSNTSTRDTFIHTGTKPNASFFYPVLYTCASDPVSFRNTTTGSVTSWLWDFGDGDTSTRKSPNHYFQDTGFLRITLIATENGCSDTATSSPKDIYIKPPIVKIRENYNCDSPYVRTFQAKYLGATSFYWDFGDGTRDSINKFPVHTFPAKGFYPVGLYGFGPECSYHDTVIVTIIDENPVINFNAPPICKNDSVNFNVTNYDPTLLSAFSWTYGDGASSAFSTSNLSTHTYINAGNYTASLITQDILGCYDTTTSGINIYGPTAAFTNLNATCTKYPATFTDQSTTDGIHPIKKWIWDFGDGNTGTFTSPPFTHTYNVADTFNVSLKVVDSVGCTDTISKINAIITVPKPIANFTMNPSPDCFSTPVSFTDNSQGQQLGRIWYFGNGDTSSFPTPVYTYPDTGNYVVTLIIGKQAGCSDTLPKSLRVLPLPNVDAGLDTVICFGQSLALHANGANSYTWNADPSLNCTQCTNPVANPQISTTYHVTGNDAFGCSASDSIFVEVKQPITLSVANKDTVCFGSSKQLFASGAELYNWQPTTGLNNPNIPNPVATPTDTGNIVYTVTGTDTKSCFTDTAITTLIVAPMPQFNIIDTNVTIAAGATYLIKTTSSPDVISWQWSPATDLSCTNCPQPVAKGNKIIQYTGIAANAYGCSVSDKILVRGLCNSQVIFIPNTFSPNGDHVNDYFYPRGSGLYLIKSMRIFNRIGQLVYEKNNFAPDVETEGWNGTFHAKKLPADVYVYFIEVMCNNGVVVSFKGDITLL